MQFRDWYVIGDCQFAPDLAPSCFRQYRVTCLHVPDSDDCTVLIPQYDIRSDGPIYSVFYNVSEAEALFDAISTYSWNVLPSHIVCKNDMNQGPV